MQLSQVFTKAAIYYYFNLKYYIWITINRLKYAINKVFTQIILNWVFFDHINFKNLTNLNFFMFQISQ